MAIDIGAAAIDRATTYNPAYTLIALDNPANASGTLTSIEIYCSYELSDCKVGTFSRDGAKFTCRDYEVIGSVTAGSKQTFTVNITCVSGDYIGFYFSSGTLEGDSSGYAGVYLKSGDQFEAGEQTYSLNSGDAFSVYGIGGTTINYYFNSKSTSVWSDPEKMIDNNLANYAYTSSDADTEVLDGNTGSGTDLGAITKVEIRAYAYGDGNDRIDLTPVFAGGDGDEHQTTPGTSGAWGAYQDITSDTNHPSPWTWSAVQALDCKVEKDTVSKGNAMYCAKVEIRVTYIPTGAFVPFPLLSGRGGGIGEAIGGGIGR